MSLEDDLWAVRNGLYSPRDAFYTSGDLVGLRSPEVHGVFKPGSVVHFDEKPSREPQTSLWDRFLLSVARGTDFLFGGSPDGR